VFVRVRLRRSNQHLICLQSFRLAIFYFRGSKVVPAPARVGLMDLLQPRTKVFSRFWIKAAVAVFPEVVLALGLGLPLEKLWSFHPSLAFLGSQRFSLFGPLQRATGLCSGRRHDAESCLILLYLPLFSFLSVNGGSPV